MYTRSRRYPFSCHEVLYLLVQTARWRHGRLDRQAADVLPALFQQGDEVVDGQHDVADELVLRHPHVTHGHPHAQHLFQLELDRRLDLGQFGVEIFRVRDWCGDFAGCGFFFFVSGLGQLVVL